jgi:nitrite reductase/ring-hydroxylating ferredoxin subunit
VTWVDVGPDGHADEVGLREIHLGARRLGLARVGRRWVAFDALCPHAGCPLADGWLEGTSVRCACHGGLFDLETGTALDGPTHDPLALFPTRVVGGRVEIDVG